MVVLIVLLGMWMVLMELGMRIAISHALFLEVFLGVRKVGRLFYVSVAKFSTE